MEDCQKELEEMGLLLAYLLDDIRKLDSEWGYYPAEMRASDLASYQSARRYMKARLDKGRAVLVGKLKENP